MKERNEHGLTQSQQRRLLSILHGLQGALESVRNEGGTPADVECWKRPLFERASAILGENLTRYHQTMAALRLHGIVDEQQEEADRRKAANRLARIERAERRGLPYHPRDCGFMDDFD